MTESISLCLGVGHINRTYNDNTPYYNVIYSNSVGSIDINKSKITFNKINLPILLGDLYNKYEYFYIELTQFYYLKKQSTSINNAWSNIGIMNVELSSDTLQFINCGYNQTNKGIFNKGIIASYNMGSNYNVNGINIAYPNNTGCRLLFKKNKINDFNLTVKLYPMYLKLGSHTYTEDFQASSMADSTDTMAHSTFMFKIYPMENV